MAGPTRRFSPGCVLLSSIASCGRLRTDLQPPTGVGGGGKQNRKPTWYLFVGDHKLNRVFVLPLRVTDIGTTRVRTLRHQFQAPPAPGLYTLQMYLESDSYLGTGVQKSMQVSRNVAFLLDPIFPVNFFLMMAFVLKPKTATGRATSGR
jgi:hypothetical protein